MCEITFAYALDGKIEKDDIKMIINFMDKADKTNRDGFGIFNGDVLYKVNGRFDKNKDSEKILKLFNNSRFIMAHNRYMTSGKKCIEHTHPLETENIIFVHNGVIYSDGFFKDKELDSLKIGEVIEKELSKGNDIIESMQEGFKKLWGSFSVFVYDKKSERLFYTRHNAGFTFLLIKENNKRLICGNTSSFKLDYFFKNNTKNKYGFKTNDMEVCGVKIPKENIIYEITGNGLKVKGSYSNGFNFYPQDPMMPMNDVIVKKVKKLDKNVSLYRKIIHWFDN